MKNKQLLVLFIVMNLLFSHIPVAFGVETKESSTQTEMKEESGEIDQPVTDETKTSDSLGEIETPPTTESSSSTSESEAELIQEELPKEEPSGEESQSPEPTETEVVKPFSLAKVGSQKYLTITNQNYQIWQDFDGQVAPQTSDLWQQTFAIKTAINHTDGNKYYLITNEAGDEIGLIAEKDITLAIGAEGAPIKTDFFVTIIEKNKPVWQNFQWESSSTTDQVINKTYQVKEMYHHLNGTKYLALSNSQGQLLGYVEEAATEKVTGPEGKEIKADYYVTIKSKTENLAQDFNGDKQNNTKDVYQKTLHVKKVFYHFNGTTYLAVYNKQDKWLGYIDQKATQKAKGAQGFGVQTNYYISVTRANYKLWGNFDWKAVSQSKQYHQQTLHVKRVYYHFSGATYLSLYNSQGQWLGYLNQSATQKVSGPQGSGFATNYYVMINSKNYKLWHNFNWQQKSKSSQYYQQTLQVRRVYRHLNGSKYLSLYNKQGKWQGYINETGTRKAKGQQGVYIADRTLVRINSRNYIIWNDFNWSKGTKTTNLLNTTYTAKGYYRHFNGAKYYSLYNSNNRWVGYINAGGVSVAPGAAKYLGTSRSRIVSELSRHQSSNFYLRTPYRSVGGSRNPNRVMSPRGAPNSFGPGFNCTGFVAYATRAAGGNINKITNVANDWGGVANAYNWRDALTRNTAYYTYDSISQLLNSGQASKGDIIYFEPDRSKPGYDSHIGIFWGENSNHDRIWHSTLPGNNISRIYSGTPYTKIYLFKLD